MFSGNPEVLERYDQKEQLKRNTSNTLTSSTASTSLGSDSEQKSSPTSVDASFSPKNMKIEKIGKPPTGRVSPPPIPGSFASILTLAKKKRTPPPPKFATNGVINPYYNIGGSDYSISSKGTSSAGSIAESSVASGASTIENGYNFPSTMKSGYELPPAFTNYDVANDDDASQRTPLPTKLPSQKDSVLPSNFLRDRKVSTSNLSELSSEESETPSVQREQREQKNVGRLVVAAKAQHHLKEQWFATGVANALPGLPPMTRKPPTQAKRNVPTNAPPNLIDAVIRMPKPTGPIDLDSGEPWGGDDDGTIKNTVAYTTYTGKTKKAGNLSFNIWGVIDDEDLTVDIQRKGWERTVCKIGNSRCSLLAFVIASVVFLALMGTGAWGVMKYLDRNGRDGDTIVPFSNVTTPTTLRPTGVPSAFPTSTPTLSPSISLNPSPRPTARPSVTPSTSPSSTPTHSPSSAPSVSPSGTPSRYPTAQPTNQPSISLAPSVSFAPSRIYSNTAFNEIGNGIALYTNGQDQSGYAVSLSKDGGILAIGSPSYPVGRVTVHKGVYNEGEFSWEQMGQELKGNTTEYGTCLQLSEDGMTLALGDPLYDSERGLVQVFQYNTTLNEWMQLGENIKGEDKNIWFGFSVSISGDGKRLAIGAPRYSFFVEGQVYVYFYKDGQWGDSVEVPSQMFNINGQFGYDVSLSSDGSTLACGSPYTNNVGYVAVFKWNAEDGIYDSEEKILGFAGDKFGISVSLSLDGSYLAVGSPFLKVDTFDNSGRVGVYKILKSGGITQVGKDIVGDPVKEQRLGWSVSISWDGKIVAIGTQPFRNQVFVHRFTGGIWGDAVVITGTEDDKWFGYDVDLARDSNILVVGAPGGITKHGIVRSYRWDS